MKDGKGYGAMAKEERFLDSRPAWLKPVKVS